MLDHLFLSSSLGSCFNVFSFCASV
jgi:hypothetical protein